MKAVRISRPVRPIVDRGSTAVGRVALAAALTFAVLFVLSATVGGTIGLLAELLAIAIGVFGSWLVMSFCTLATIRNLSRPAPTSSFMIVPAAALLSLLWLPPDSVWQVGMLSFAIASFLAACFAEGAQQTRLQTPADGLTAG